MISSEFKKQVSKKNLWQLQNFRDLLFSKYAMKDDPFQWEKLYGEETNLDDLREQIVYVDDIVRALFSGNYIKTENEIIIKKKERVF